MAILRRADQIPTGLSRILLPGEQLVTAVHSHWVRLVKPVAICVAILAVTITVDANLTPAIQRVGDALWIVSILSLGWLGWQLLEWRHDWFVATDKRLLLRYGLITHKVAMMPLIKVTDMSYVRSIPGQLLGYGRFVMESAGQDQAMRTVDWVPRPDETYRAICGVIFSIGPPPGTATIVEIEEEGPGPDGDGPDRGGGPDDEGGPGDADGGGAAGRPAPKYGTSTYPDVPPIHNPVQDRLDQYSRAIPIRRVRGGESLYESEDRRRRRRSADTGPVPLKPKHDSRD